MTVYPYNSSLLIFLNQMSGQGPYFGQAGWFTHYHVPPVSSARTRYINEIRRVTSVLDKCVEGKDYLVGGKCSFADLAFVTWYWGLERVDFDGGIGLRAELEGNNLNWKTWLQRLEAREMVTKVRDEMLAVYMANQQMVGDEAREKAL
jgi:glutathione S-transferase